MNNEWNGILNESWNEYHHHQLNELIINERILSINRPNETIPNKCK